MRDLERFSQSLGTWHIGLAKARHERALVLEVAVFGGGVQSDHEHEPVVVGDRLAVGGPRSGVVPAAIVEVLELPFDPRLGRIAAIGVLGLAAVADEHDGVADVSLVADAPEREVPVALLQQPFVANTYKSRHLEQPRRHCCWV